MARILLGVTGGIAAYKAVELVRLATGAGHAVRVIQTPASLNFVGRATFEGVTGAPVLVEEFERDPAGGAFPGDQRPDHDPISHLELVRRCDVLAVAPASANTIAKLAGGLADNLLTSAALAATVPLVVAPAMNDRMYRHPATQGNLETLRLRGARIVPPDEGRLASKGEWGTGRLANPERILEEIERALREDSGREFALQGDPFGAPFAGSPHSMDGLKVLVTAGGTREPIDAVRYVGNRSSGRMGLALAEEAARRGAEVTVIAANVALTRPEHVRVVDVKTAAELEAAARREFAHTDVLLMAAAVADFRPRNPESAKIKKAGRDSLALDLEATADVLGALASARREGQTLVGFAAEHGGDVVAEARAKLERKGLDMVVVNDVSRSDIGFDAEENEVTIVTAGAGREVPHGPKPAIAAAVLDEVERLRTEATAATTLGEA